MARGHLYKPMDNSQFKAAVNHWIPQSITLGKEPEKVWRSLLHSIQPNWFVISFAVSHYSKCNVNETLPVDASHLKLSTCNTLESFYCEEAKENADLVNFFTLFVCLRPNQSLILHPPSKPTKQGLVVYQTVCLFWHMNWRWIQCLARWSQMIPDQSKYTTTCQTVKNECSSFTLEKKLTLNVVILLSL